MCYACVFRLDARRRGFKRAALFHRKSRCSVRFRFSPCRKDTPVRHFVSCQLRGFAHAVSFFSAARISRAALLRRQRQLRFFVFSYLFRAVEPYHEGKNAVLAFEEHFAVILIDGTLDTFKPEAVCVAVRFRSIEQPFLVALRLGVGRV